MIEQIIYYLFLLDSIGANYIVWFQGKWYCKNFRIFCRQWPPAKGWAAIYLGLVLWVGWLYMRLGVL
ncbi:MAG: hypothetical protein CMH61_01795 [Nanoarchaeota archaeon]|nr:hypothetical protein [Nanoarchaeota archaeon]